MLRWRLRDAVQPVATPSRSIERGSHSHSYSHSHIEDLELGAWRSSETSVSVFVYIHVPSNQSTIYNLPKQIGRAHV